MSGSASERRSVHAIGENRFFRFLGDVFNPLIPAFICAGIAAGIATVIQESVSSWEGHRILYLASELLLLVNHSFTPFMTAWIGYMTSLSLGGTAILGGMVGMVTGLSGISNISSFLGLGQVLQSGSGGVIAAFIGAWMVSTLEKSIHRHMPKSIDLVFTPMLSLGIVVIPYVLVVMPLAGFVAKALGEAMDVLSGGSSHIVKVFSGFLCAFAFLPINVCGLQHGIIALYPIQLEQHGFITLYPVFAMAGAAQVGAGVAVALHARQVKNDALFQVAASSVVPGMLGVGAPLIFGVTLPHPRSFFASCLGAGIGGAFIMLCGVVSSGWGPSGLLAMPMMTSNRYSSLASMGLYLAGLALSAISGFFFCLCFTGKSYFAECVKT